MDAPMSRERRDARSDLSPERRRCCHPGLDPGYIETCSECGGDVRIIASIEDPVVIRMILVEYKTNTILPENSKY